MSDGKRISGQVTSSGSPTTGSKYTISQSTTGLVVGFNSVFKNQPVAVVTASPSNTTAIQTVVDSQHLEINWDGSAPDFLTFYVTDQGLGYY